MSGGKGIDSIFICVNDDVDSEDDDILTLCPKLLVPPSPPAPPSPSVPPPPSQHVGYPFTTAGAYYASAITQASSISQVNSNDRHSSVRGHSNSSSPSIHDGPVCNFMHFVFLLFFSVCDIYIFLTFINFL